LITVEGYKIIKESKMPNKVKNYHFDHSLRLRMNWKPEAKKQFTLSTNWLFIIALYLLIQPDNKFCASKLV